MSKAPSAHAWEPEDVPTDDLDLRHPRLTDYDIAAKAGQEEIVGVLWSNMAVDELALSIAENGFIDTNRFTQPKNEARIT
jgi:hypothetical protein